MGAWVAISEIASSVARGRSSNTAARGSALLGRRCAQAGVSAAIGSLLWCVSLPGWAQATVCTVSPCLGNSIYTPPASGLNQNWDFWDSSELKASSAAPVKGGTQNFYHTSKLVSQSADAMQGANVHLFDSSFVAVNAVNALRGAKVNLQSAGSTLYLGGNSTSVSGLTGWGTVKGGGGAPTLTVDVAAGTDFMFWGWLGTTTGSDGDFAVVKTGSGQWTLSGENHSFRNGLQVLGGTLHVNTPNPGFQLGAGSIVVDDTAQQSATLSIAASTGLHNLIEVRQSGVLLNKGTISSLGNQTGHYGDPAVRVGAAGVVRNEGARALIYDADAGVLGLGPDAVVQNRAGARIKGIGGVGVGVALTHGGEVSNDGTGSLIEGNGWVVGAGVSVQGAAGNVFNTNGASIKGNGLVGTGVQMLSGGGVFNGAGSTIEGSAQSVTASSAAITLTNAGNLVGKVALADGFAHQVTLISGGQIQAAGAGSADLDMGQHVDAILTLQADTDQLHSAAVSGQTLMAGQLVKTGSATWTLDKTINARSTTIEAGTLALQGAGHHGSGLVHLAASGAQWDISAAGTAPVIAALYGVAGSTVALGQHALTVGDSTDSAFAGRITGAGSLVKEGSGTLTLSGVNDYQGGTRIHAGAVVATAASLGSGAVTNLAQLELQQTQDGELASALYGTGQVYKTGAGALTLSGDSSSFAGNTTVRSGGLLLAATGQLGGRVTVGTGSVLGGIGAVGSVGQSTTVQAGGTLAPGWAGAADGTLHVRGHLVMQPGAQLRVTADPATNRSTRVVVDGQAQLAGGVVQVGPQSTLEVGQTYTLLTASSVQGRFDSVTSNYAYLIPSLSYDAQNVELELQRKPTPTPAPAPTPAPIAFADLANTTNQAAVANGVESLPSTHALYRFVERLPNGAPPAVFDSLSGDGHAQLAGSLQQLATRAPSIGMHYMRLNLSAGWWPGAALAQSHGLLPASAWPVSKALPAWAQIVGHWHRRDGDNNAAPIRQHTYGLSAGLDREVGAAGWRVGGALGVSQAQSKVTARAMDADIQSYSASIYTGKSFAHRNAHMHVMGGMAYTWHSINTQRHVTSLGQTLQGDYHAQSAQVFGELSYAMGPQEATVVEPFASLGVGRQHVQGFSERGGFAALDAQSQRSLLASTTLGVRLHRDVRWGHTQGHLRATLGWQRAWGDRTPQSTLSFAGGQSFTVAGTMQSRNTAVLGLEAEVALSRSIALSLGYQGELARGQRDHTGKLQLRWAF